jgi:Spy/CpxP family protein refolding chaperone
MFNARALRLPALLLALGATVAFAKGEKTGVSGDRAGKHIDRFVGKMEKGLSLSKEQSEKIREILKRDSAAGMAHYAHGKKGCKDCRHCMHGMSHGGHGELARQLRAENADTAALNARFAEKVEAMRAMHAARSAKFAEVHAVLTPEQRAKAAAHLEKRGAKASQKCERKCGKGCAH